jgi:2-keto-4-pentenoate hydratase
VYKIRQDCAMTFEPARAAAAFLRARKSKRLIDQLPEGSQPTSETDVYLIQDLVAKTLGPVVAWKVGSATVDSEPFRAPIHRDTVFIDQTCIPAKMFHVIGVEAELVYAFKRDLPPEGTPYSLGTVLDAIGAIMPGIEIVDTRFKIFGGRDPLAHRADQGNHGALILGTPVHSWRSLVPSNLSVRLQVDGKILREAVGGNSAVDPVRLLVWLVNEGSRSLGGVRAGQVVTTGSCTGTIFVNPGTSTRATFPGLGTLEIKMN